MLVKLESLKFKTFQVAMEASFISGLSMCNQHTSILYIGVIGLWMFISLIRDKVCFEIFQFHITLQFIKP